MRVRVHSTASGEGEVLFVLSTILVDFELVFFVLCFIAIATKPAMHNTKTVVARRTGYLNHHR